MAGRKPVGPALADRVAGSDEARQRLKVLLETITGDKSMEEACRALGIQKSRLFKVREEMLQAAVESLEPGPMGRPPKAAGPEETRIAELEERVHELQQELEAARVRAELAHALPSLAEEKKSPPRKKKKPQRRRKRKR